MWQVRFFQITIFLVLHLIGPSTHAGISNRPNARDLTGSELEKAVWSTLRDVSRITTPTKSDILSVLDLLDHYNESVDLPMDLAQPKSAYYDRWDRQANVMLALQTWFQKIQTTMISSDLKSGPRSLLSVVRHPYTLLYLLKADLNRPHDDRFFEQSDVDARLDFSRRDYLENNFFSELETHAHFSGNKIMTEAFKYRYFQYASELTRLLIDKLSDDWGWSASPTDRRRYLYHALRKSLVERTKEALSIRYGEQPSGFAVLPIQGIVSPTDHSRINLIGDTLVIRANETIDIPPGVYHASQNVAIFAKEIRFHPLSMIHVPGKKIILNAKTIVSPWLDVSGELAFEIDGQNAGSIQVQLSEQGGELLGSLLLVAIGSHGRTMSCISSADRPGNGGDGGVITLSGGTPFVNFKSMLSFPGDGGLLSCSGSDKKGNPGRFTSPVFVSKSNEGPL